MCSGRVDPQFVLKPFRNGAHGVLIFACHPGDCHYKEGNYRAVQRHRILLRLLRQFGIEEERCRFDYVSAGEGEKFVRLITEFAAATRAAGPNKFRHPPKVKYNASELLIASPAASRSPAHSPHEGQKMNFVRK